jgi:8-oxo-dGTP pyrophosphatase MutT (NUDIX family)
MAAADELVEHVDELGGVLSIVTRGQMRSQNLRHRSTYVVVRARSGAVLTHRRADWKDLWPGRWDVAFGGVCAVGERWASAAARELAEEAGVHLAPDELDDLGELHFDGAVHVVGRLFSVVHEGPFAFDDGEVVEAAWIDPQALSVWASSHELCDDARQVILPRL